MRAVGVEMLNKRGGGPPGCALHLKVIAAAAGVSVGTARDALNIADTIGLITAGHLRGFYDIRSHSPEWLAALRELQERIERSASMARRPAALRGLLQGAFVNDEQQRLLEIEDMRLVVKFGEKKRYSDQECQAIYQELVEAGLDDEARRDPDAIEAVFRKLNAADEAEAARRDLCG
jgi:hypothetical protein